MTVDVNVRLVSLADDGTFLVECFVLVSLLNGGTCDGIRTGNLLP